MTASIQKERKQFCVRGHDTFAVGRYKDGSCAECKRENRRNQYIPHPQPPKQFCIHGHDTFKCGRDKEGWCNECKPIYNKKYKKEHRNEMLEYLSLYYKNNAEESAKYYQEHRENILFHKKEDRKKHPEIYRLKDLRQHTKRKLRIPNFGQEGIFKFYVECPKGYQVDHVIPLCGKKVSGLHVSWNLQYLTESDNHKKCNKVNLIKISEEYGKLLTFLGLK